MIDHEARLMNQVLKYDAGHPRRTQHVLKVYALAKLLGEQEQLSVEDQQILQAAAILHDITIKYCKEYCDGDANQENQQREAPHLVHDFLSEADYLPSCISQITELVLHHHDYERPRSRLLQLLMEADLIVNCYESELRPEKAESIRQIFQTTTGKELLELCLKNRA